MKHRVPCAPVRDLDEVVNATGTCTPDGPGVGRPPAVRPHVPAQFGVAFDDVEPMELKAIGIADGAGIKPQ